MSRDFPGTTGNAYFTAGTPFSLNTWTGAGWVWLDSAPGSGCPCMFTHQYTGGNMPAVIGIGDGAGSMGTSGRWGVGHWNGAWHALNDTIAAPTGVWTHIAGSINGTAAKFWRNGVNVSSTTFGASASGATNQFRVGRRWDSEGTAAAHIDGRMAELGFWTAVLSDQEVAALARGVPPPGIRRPSLLAYWPLWGNGTEADFSGGGRDLTVVGTVNAGAYHAPVGRMSAMPVGRLSGGRG